MFCVDKKLIEEELNRTEDNGFKFHYRKLSNRFIDWIFRHYYIHEMCENYIMMNYSIWMKLIMLNLKN